MNYKVIDFKVGFYDSDTVFIDVDKEIYQIPVSKKAKVSKDLVDKLITIDNLYNVPLDKIVLANIVVDKK